MVTRLVQGQLFHATEVPFVCEERQSSLARRVGVPFHASQVVKRLAEVAVKGKAAYPLLRPALWHFDGIGARRWSVVANLDPT